MEWYYISKTAVRGLLLALLFRPLPLKWEHHLISEPDMSVRDVPCVCGWTTGSPDDYYTKKEKPDGVSFKFEGAQLY